MKPDISPSEIAGHLQYLGPPQDTLKPDISLSDMADHLQYLGPSETFVLGYWLCFLFYVSLGSSKKKYVPHLLTLGVLITFVFLADGYALILDLKAQQAKMDHIDQLKREGFGKKVVFTKTLGHDRESKVLSTKGY